MTNKYCAMLAAGCAAVLLAAGSAAAVQKGPTLVSGIVGGAGSGAVVGFSGALISYGVDNNRHPEVLLSGTVYGFLAGASAGTGLGVYQIATDTPEDGLRLGGYISGGTGIGAVLGVVVATLPYLRDEDPEDFTIGLGLGGVIGAAFGLGLAIADFGSDSGQGALLSGEIGIHPEVYAPPVLSPEMKREQPILSCRLVKLNF